jgi:hypothetical protein
LSPEKDKIDNLQKYKMYSYLRHWLRQECIITNHD